MVASSSQLRGLQDSNRVRSLSRLSPRHHADRAKLFQRFISRWREERTPFLIRAVTMRGIAALRGGLLAQSVEPRNSLTNLVGGKRRENYWIGRRARRRGLLFVVCLQGQDRVDDWQGRHHRYETAASGNRLNFCSEYP